MRISMPRGDIKLVRFLINDPDGTASNVDFTEIHFTVKKNFKERTFFFQKKLSAGGIVKLDLGDYQVKIEPLDTSNMSYGAYKFDIQFQYEDQLKETFTGDFILTEEATFNENE